MQLCSLSLSLPLWVGLLDATHDCWLEKYVDCFPAAAGMTCICKRQRWFEYESEGQDTNRNALALKYVDRGSCKDKEVGVALLRTG